MTTGLAEAVRALAERPNPIDLQLVAQVASVPGYAAWRDERTKLWKRQANGWTTKQWPKSLPPKHLACLVLPLPAGTKDAGDLEPVAPPLIASGLPLSGGFSRPEDGVVLAVVAAWAQWAAEQPGGIRLAPPLVERFVRGQVEDRWVADVGVEWTLTGTGDPRDETA